MMTKQATTFELVLPARDPEIPAFRWLYSALRGEILEGRIRRGARLPATRDLARQYGLARGTVVNAFDQLQAEGYVESTVGSGTFVSQILPDQLLHVARDSRSRPVTAARPRRHLSGYGRRVCAFPTFDMRRPTRAFRSNLPALDLFPASVWTQVSARRLRRTSTNLLLGCGPMGYQPLRDALAAYLSASRGVKCDSGQIAIVSGVQEALDLSARLLVDPGDRVCMENPGYVGAARVFEAFGAKLVPASLDGQGMVVQPGRMRGVRLVYVTPGHEFPLGITMSLARRLDLLEWARKSGALIFEDDYDSEYRYSGRPVPALQGLDRNQLVIFAGSFSKVLFPSLRLGYLVLPPDLVERFSATLSITARHTPLLEQAILCDFIAEGHFGRHLRRMREIYAQRLGVLLDAARERLAGLLEISGIEAGLQTAGWLCGEIDGESAAAAAAQRGVDVIPLSRFSYGHPPREGLQLGFAAIDPREIRRGVQELAVALESESGRTAGSGRKRERS